MLSKKIVSAAFAALLTPVAFGSLPASTNFDKVDAYADLSAYANASRSQITFYLYGTIGAVKTLLKTMGPYSAGATPAKLVTIESEPGVTYSLEGAVTAGDVLAAPIKAGLVGYDQPLNVSYDLDATASPTALVYNTEVTIADVLAIHSEWNTRVDTQGAKYPDVTYRFYNVITDGANTITALITEHRLTKPPTGGFQIFALSDFGGDHILVTAEANDVRAAGANAISLKHATIGSDPITDNGSLPSADVVWRPGGVAGGNVYTTWPTALAAAVASSDVGPVALACDDTLAPCNIDNVGMPAGGWDMQARIYRVAGGTPAFRPTCRILDGATLLDDPGVARAIGGLDTTLLAGASGLPSLRYTRTMQASYNDATLDGSAATIPPIQIDAGKTLALIMTSLSAIQPGAAGAELFSLGVASSLQLVMLDGSVFLPATNLFRGAAPATVILARDPSTASVLLTPAFTGTFTVLTRKGPIVDNGDIATGVGGGSTFVVDATALTTGIFTQAIYCRGAAGAVTVQLPNPALPGNQFRRILIVDDDGTSGATPIVLTPFAGANLNGAAASKNLSSPHGMWLVTMNGVSCVVAQLAGVP